MHGHYKGTVTVGMLIILVLTRFALLGGLCILAVASASPRAFRRRSRLGEKI